MPLEEYRRKRDFSKTPEPRPKAARPRQTQLSYVIQKHAASRLHYDFRLELDGVLLSWAVTKGPSLNPADKRLAVRTEDHPLDYGGFEGAIPQGEYGGGTVMLWDRGSWTPKGDPHAALKKGHLSFDLQGSRLKGGWDLVRMRGDGKRENWLLIKEKDAEAREEGEIIGTETASVATGRSMEEIAQGAGPRKPARAQKSPDGDLVLHGVTITHPGRIISETANMTKGDLARYYAQAAPFLLASVARHPLSLLRCPSGIDNQCFYQRNPGKGLGPDVHPFDFSHKGKHYEYLYIDDAAGLMELVQMGAIEIHPWGASIDSIDYPDRLIFDLDPAPDVPFEAVKLAAQDLRLRLRKRGLESSPKCTGGKGLHVTVALAGDKKWADVKSLGAAIAREMVDAAPEAYVATMTKSKRTGKIFIDYFRNDYTATAIADYSVRARPGAPVAVPVDWKELPQIKSGDQFHIEDVMERLRKRQPGTAPRKPAAARRHA